MDVVLMVLIIVFTVILLGLNIYLMILYCHKDDRGWGNALYCKILVVLGLTLCQAQALMVPLDVANRTALITGDKINMATFWAIIYIIILFFIVIFLPYAMFFYQTDQQDSYPKRLLVALAYTSIAIVVTVIILFVSWAFFKFVDLPYKAVSVPESASTDVGKNPILDKSAYNDQTIQLQTSLAVYIIAILSFFGWILLVIFGGTGFTALPIDMITQFIKRPKARKSNDMIEAKNNMVTAINILIKEGEQMKQLDAEQAKNKQGSWFGRWKQGKKVDKKLTQFKAKYYALSEEYAIWNLQRTYQQTNPIIPFLKMLLGIIFALTSFLWVLQIIFGNIAKSGTDRPLIPFFNQLLIYMQDNNAGFVGTAIFGYLCLYVIWCVQKGNIRFGLQIPLCCKFHPIKQNETWMNSFLFNIILLLLASVGVIQLCISSFPTYTRNTQIYMIFGVQIQYMRFYKEFYKNNVFTIMLIIWIFLSLIILLCLCRKKPEYMEAIDKIRSDKKKYEKINQ